MTATEAWPTGMRAAVTDALARWLPERRWFGAAGRRIERLELVRVVEIMDHSRYTGPRGVLAVAAAQFADADPSSTSDIVHYQILLGLRRVDPHGGGLSPALGPEIITRYDDLWIYDATADPELMSSLLGLIAHGGHIGTVRFTPESPESLCLGERAGLAVRRGSSEQSNTSMVYGDRFILKLFRRLVIGTNPELDVHRGMRCSHDPHLATLLGAIEIDLDAGPVTLGVLHSFVPDAIDGWELVTKALRKAMSGDPACAELRPALYELGAAVAAVHGHLAESFGSAELTEPRLVSLKEELRNRLSAAARAAPVLLDYFGALGDVIDDARASSGERLQRIHGDLHLGQTLHTSAGWVLIDFEGEPATSIHQRVSWRSPLQDVAGMLRSLDYAAGYLLLTDGGAAGAAADWVAGAREAFWNGYTEASGGRPVDRNALLRAYEVDKAAYEVAYDSRNRPEWLSIPLGAVQRLTGNVEGQPDRPSEVRPNVADSIAEQQHQALNSKAREC